MEQQGNQYEQERRSKMRALREMGVEPFGGRETGIQNLAEARAIYKPEMGHDGGPNVKVAGRIIFVRDIGKLQFQRVRDEHGELQIAFDKKRLSESDWNIVKHLDLGDQIIVEGPLGSTKTGEVTIWAKTLRMGSKALLPPPAKWQGLQDVELRYRQRYVDLWANPQVMTTLKLRSQIVAEIRRYMSERGYLEVETPMMQALAGGATARPFVTHHNALDIDLFLRIAPELYLKRLLVGGFSKVFELNRNFRNEGISPRHNPEFTMLEAYQAYGDYESMMELVQGLVCHVAENVLDTLTIEHKDAEGKVTKTINLTPPWRRVKYKDLIREMIQKDWFEMSLKERLARAIDLGVDFHGPKAAKIKELSSLRQNDLSKSEKDRISDELDTAIESYLTNEGPEDFEVTGAVFEKLIEPTLIQPTFVTHLPKELVPLAKLSDEDPTTVEVFECCINGQEIAPAYTEQNDPIEQRERLEHQAGGEQQKLDEDFLVALEHGMPPAGGTGMGIDRLCMMLLGQESIRDVILFPQLKPK